MRDSLELVAGKHEHCALCTAVHRPGRTYKQMDKRVMEVIFCLECVSRVIASVVYMKNMNRKPANCAWAKADIPKW